MSWPSAGCGFSVQQVMLDTTYLGGQVPVRWQRPSLSRQVTTAWPSRSGRLDYLPLFRRSTTNLSWQGLALPFVSVVVSATLKPISFRVLACPIVAVWTSTGRTVRSRMSPSLSPHERSRRCDCKAPEFPDTLDLPCSHGALRVWSDCLDIQPLKRAWLARLPDSLTCIAQCLTLKSCRCLS
jgi:hypothetical protein